MLEGIYRRDYDDAVSSLIDAVAGRHLMIDFLEE